ncbi:uncharacterized protein LOC116267144 [Nymphaea colorata]|nr:uncharacterized protein LOC116267144 [Nymphaea colorata]
MMSLKSLFTPKEMWACGHPKTESFRVAPDAYRSVNNMYVYSEANDAVSEPGNWFESDSSAASTSEVSSSGDSGEAAPELLVEGMRSLRSDRFFFEPDRTKSIVEEGKDKRSCFVPFLKVEGGLEREKSAGFLLVKEGKKVGSGLQGEKENGFFLFNEDKKVGSTGLERQTGNGFLLLKEDQKVGNGLQRETSHGTFRSGREKVRLVGGFKEEAGGGLLTLGAQLKVENGFEMKEDDITGDFVLSQRERSRLLGSADCERKKSDGFFVYDGDLMDVEREKKDWLLGLDQGDAAEVLTFDESMMMVMDSEDPYKDFRVSMEEMVEAYGLSEWECLEEMLVWYLRANGRSAHRYIMGAFVDLLVSIVSPSHGNGAEILRRFR